jgi:hypothetical protein
MPEQTDIQITAFLKGRRIASGDVATVARAAKTVSDGGMDGLIKLFDDRTGLRLDLDFDGTPAEVADRAEWLRAYLADQEAGGAAVTGAGGGTGGGTGAASGAGASGAAGSRAGGPGQPRGRGRPKLGVLPREVTVLPRHWAWLDSQRGSASAALRRLVDEARKLSEGVDRVRHAQDAAYRFMYDSAGDAPGFQEAIRSLYRCDAEGFEAATEAWAADLRDYARELAADAFTGEETR